MSYSVLIAEAEQDLADVLVFVVRLLWPECRVQLAVDSTAVLHQVAADPPDLVILDSNIPGSDTFEICRRIHAAAHMPILMLTTRENMAERVRALEPGADDYIVKPIDYLELQARLRTLRERFEEREVAGSAPIVVGEVRLDAAMHVAKVRGREVRLTVTESRLLELLMRHAGTPLTHRYILAHLWGPQHRRNGRHIKVFVQRLRHKLGDDSKRPRFIQTIWGTGYCFLASTEQGP